MSTPAPDVVSPVQADADELAKASASSRPTKATAARFLHRRSSSPGPRSTTGFELTEQVRAILKQVVPALSNGQSISIFTRDQEISTQQAADILGLSRPTVVRLIDEGELTAHVPGAVRRKLRLADVLAYREELRARRNRFITESSAAYDEGEEDAAALLVEARKTR